MSLPFNPKISIDTEIDAIDYLRFLLTFLRRRHGQKRHNEIEVFVESKLFLFICELTGACPHVIRNAFRGHIKYAKVYLINKGKNKGELK
ncbi:hypothetical protein Galf_1534 [Gallionella capsiferriformans ES-2]|uniref:Uncharacterized protein n=1 Tax=Gallionella capsiferriformans (strain ES-2) TaxID=395494 RepID=D9SGA6_GALCS|nr:hypothetical protein Galf_1534 [Gallionella capsiferriformans ES-2]